MSIDREVNSRANAYMGNETALREKYALEQDLIDLLALQKLKSDREAAEKEMRMKAQVSPAKVKDQLRNENLEATKQQIVGGMPQEGILTAAQGGMVRRFAEGGEVDLDEAEQTLPFDETVDVDLDEAIQASPFDETVEVDPEKMEELLDSSSEDEEIQKEIARKVQRAARGFISPFTGNTPNRVLEGSPAYRQKEKEVREEVFQEKVDDLLEKKLDPKTVQSDEDFKKGLLLQALRDTGQISAEELYEFIKSGQLPKADTGTDTDTDTGTSDAPTEPTKSVFDKIMERLGVTTEDQVDNLDVQGQIKTKEAILARLAELNNPEEKEFIDVASTAMRGRGLYGPGGASYALSQDELARRKRKKEYQTMLVENEDQIADLTQELGDKEMAIKLTAATNEYARDVQAKALAIDNARDRRDFILRSMELMAKNVDKTIGDNLIVMKRLEENDAVGASKVGATVRNILMESPHYQALERMLVEMGVSLTGSPSGRKPIGDFNTKS